MIKEKIFGIGLSRTGTTSLNNALKILGIKSIHFPYQLFDDISHDIINQYQSFTDNPIPLLYKELDIKYKNSKFILTYRDVDEWLKSMKWMFDYKFEEWNLGNYPQNEMFYKQYGRYDFDELEYKIEYISYIESVKEYFKHRENNLLIIDLVKTPDEIKWQKLVDFLEIKNFDTTIKFPNSNGAAIPSFFSEKKKKIRKLVMKWFKR